MPRTSSRPSQAETLIKRLVADLDGQEILAMEQGRSSISSDLHERIVALYVDASAHLRQKGSIHYRSLKQDWATPPEIFDPLDAIFHFNLDAAASDEEHRCSRYFTAETDGLAQEWVEPLTGCHEFSYPSRVWLNPPFDHVKAWMKKAVEEAKKGALVVALVANRRDTSWWQDYVSQAEYIIDIRGRITFKGAPNPASFPSAIAIFSPLSRSDLPASNFAWDYRRQPVPDLISFAYQRVGWTPEPVPLV